MHSHRLSVLIALVLLSGSAGAVEAPPQGPVAKELGREMKARALAASFEVVVPRPDESSITYEKELPPDLIPFHIRNDKYYSIGTAFAVSPTELVTAFHVLNLLTTSLTFRQFYIRDASGDVYEVDQITGSDQDRDVVRFTVKGGIFKTWLDLDSDWQVNEPVFSVGNALGEGNVIRRGELIGTVKEAIDGRWDLLKSSADVNGGNSGGPLLDQQGRVIGVVVQRNDNISLSLPVAEVTGLSTATAMFFTRLVYTFPVIPEQSAQTTIRFELPIPASYEKLRAAATERFAEANETGMSAFLGEHSPELFPAGKSSQEAVVGIARDTYAEMYLKSPEDKLWYLSDLKTRSSDLGGNGELRVSPLSENLVLGSLRLPDGMAMEEMFRTPKVFMDLLYKGMEINRSFGAQKFRITSIGKPNRQATLRDRWGRQWFQSVWLNPLSDKVTIAYLTPVPGGAAYMLREVESFRSAMVESDDKRLIDFIFVPYAGRLKDWQQLMAMGDRLPESFSRISLDVKTGQFLRLDSPWVTINLQHKDWPIEENGWLNLGMGFSDQGGQTSWGMRRLILKQYESDEYFTLLKHVQPFPGMNDSWIKDWNTATRGLHPYTGKVFSDEGKSAIAKVLASRDRDPADNHWLLTLYLSMPGTVAPGTASKFLDTLSTAIAVRADTVEPVRD